MFIKRQITIFICVVLFLFGAAFGISRTDVLDMASASVDMTPKIILDAGHGGLTNTTD